jgi:hypothetical protein
VACNEGITIIKDTSFFFCEAQEEIGIILEKENENGGGALHLQMSGVNCTNCSFINCKSNNYGGAICLARDNNNYPRKKLLVFDNCIFGSNRALYDGGAILNRQGDILCESCSFLFNEGRRSGGAIACEFYGELNFIDCVFVKNVKSNNDCTYNAKGGAIMLWSIKEGMKKIFFKDCLFYENNVITECEGV